MNLYESIKSNLNESKRSSDYLNGDMVNYFCNEYYKHEDEPHKWTKKEMKDWIIDDQKYCKSNNTDSLFTLEHLDNLLALQHDLYKYDLEESDDLSDFKRDRNIKYTKMKTNGVKDAKSILYNVILRDANKKYRAKSITREERNKIIDDAHDKLIKGKSNNILDTISDELIEKARKDFVKDYPRKRVAQKVTTEMYKKLINEADDAYMEEWRSICEAFCKKIGAKLLFVKSDNFGYEDKNGNLVHMYAGELEQFIKNGGLKESDSSFKDMPYDDRVYQVAKALVNLGKYSSKSSEEILDLILNTFGVEDPENYPKKEDILSKVNELKGNVKESESSTAVFESDDSELYVLSNAQSYDKSDADSWADVYSREAPKLDFKVRKSGDMYFVDFIGTKQDILDYVKKLGWYTDKEIEEYGLIKPLNEAEVIESYKPFRILDHEDGTVSITLDQDDFWYDWKNEVKDPTSHWGDGYQYDELFRSYLDNYSEVSDLDFDSENGMFCVYAHSMKDAKKVTTLLSKLYNDESKMIDMIKKLNLQHDAVYDEEKGVYY